MGLCFRKIGFIFFLIAVAHITESQGAILSVVCPGQSIQAAVDLAQPGDIINVSGSCSENILIRNEKRRLSLVGVGGTVPSITGPDGNLPTVNVRGKGILIQRFGIFGGLDGIHVSRGSNAVIDQSVIANNGRHGILLDQQSFAVITANQIVNHSQGSGIVVDGSSNANIGFNSTTDTSASGNTIAANSGGIVVKNSSSAKITGNTIFGNGAYGVRIMRFGHAKLGGNNIGAHINGISVEYYSGADVGNGSPPIMLLSPNISNQNVFSISCVNGGYVLGIMVDAVTGLPALRSIGTGCLGL